MGDPRRLRRLVVRFDGELRRGLRVTVSGVGKTAIFGSFFGWLPLLCVIINEAHHVSERDELHGHLLAYQRAR